MIQSLAEALDYANEIGNMNIGTLLDYRWFWAMNHPIQEIYKYGPLVSHIHMDNPATEFPRRVVPKLDDGHDYSPFISAIKEIHYDGIISIEANTFTDYEREMKQCLDFFRYYGIIPARNNK